MIVAIIGLGLIGGSLALSLRKNGFASIIIGVENNENHRHTALTLGLVDRIETLEVATDQSDIIIIATPVNTIGGILSSVLDRIKHQAVTDVGSTKWDIVNKVKNHPKRAHYVAAHPMAGTEFSGPQAAVPELFKNKNIVYCDIENSRPAQKNQIQALFDALQMQPLFMDARAHDIHTAYVSHISHISSISLALTVLEKEKNEKTIFQLASGGFSSTVRLAKSSPATWIPIFQQNRENVLDVLDEHINTLARFRNLLAKKDYESMFSLVEKANEIERVLKG